MKPLMLIVCLAITSSAVAQRDSIYGYYDMLWKKLDNKEDAKFFRVVKDRPDGKYLVRDYYISGKLQFVGICTALEPKLDIEGKGTLYHESGGVQQIGLFKEEEAVGLHAYFYEDGARHKVVFHREGEKDVYHHFWSREGEEKLVNGKGLVAEYLPGLATRYYEIEDSVVVASFSDDESGNTVYGILEQQPEYRGGYEALIKDIRATMKYPKSARKRGIEGIVYVAFLIGKKGEISNVRVLKGIQHECDVEAVRAVTTLNKWNPGMHKGEPVFVKFVLPIKFKLN